MTPEVRLEAAASTRRATAGDDDDLGKEPGGPDLRNGLQAVSVGQVDIDEQWTEQDLTEAESMLEIGSNVAGDFQFYHYLCKDSDGRQLVGKGSWGDNFVARLWWWHGQKFKTHEPPVMHGQDGIKFLPQKFRHYSYVFEQDVEFKSRYYKGYRPVLANWKMLQERRFDFPIPAKTLLGSGTTVDLTNSYITTLS